MRFKTTIGAFVSISILVMQANPALAALTPTIPLAQPIMPNLGGGIMTVTPAVSAAPAASIGTEAASEAVTEAVAAPTAFGGAPLTEPLLDLVGGELGADAQCDTVFPSCPCGTAPGGPHPGDCVAAPNQFMCPGACYALTPVGPVVGTCVAPLKCQAVSAPGIGGIGNVLSTVGTVISGVSLAYSAISLLARSGSEGGNSGGIGADSTNIDASNPDFYNSLYASDPHSNLNFDASGAPIIPLYQSPFTAPAAPTLPNFSANTTSLSCDGGPWPVGSIRFLACAAQ